MLYSFLASFTEAAPLGCSKPASLEAAYNEITSGNYVIVDLDRTPSGSLATKTTTGHINSVEHKRRPCSHSFVESKKNVNQVPATYITAKLTIEDPRCTAIVYMLTVLEKQANCDGEIGKKIWTVKRIPINVGFEM